MVGGVFHVAIDDSLVYRKSGRGAAQLASTHGGLLSPRERHVLILLDGRRTIAELCEVFGVEAVEQVVAELEARGFAKRVDTSRDDEWANAVTQFHPGLSAVVEPANPKPARGRRLDRYPLTLAMLAAGVVAIGGSYWATDRYRRQSEAMSRLDQALAQVAPVDEYGVRRSTGAIDMSAGEPLAAVIVTPISGLPTVTASEPAGAPAGALPGAAARDRKATVRSPMRAAAPLHAAAASGTGEADPAAGPAAPPPEQVVAAAGPPPASAAPPSAAPTDAPAADPPGGAAQTPVAMQAPMQPPDDPVVLRPLQQDPPRFPERALRDGIGQSQVRARLWITPEGKVDQVDILEATAPGVFDDEVRRALSLWTFEPPNRPTEQVVELTLKP